MLSHSFKFPSYPTPRLLRGSRRAPARFGVAEALGPDGADAPLVSRAAAELGSAVPTPRPKLHPRLFLFV